MTPFDAALNFADGSHLPNTYLHLINKNKRLLVSVKKEVICNCFKSPLIRTQDRSVETVSVHMFYTCKDTALM